MEYIFFAQEFLLLHVSGKTCIFAADLIGGNGTSLL